jgi:hypothetical protein
MDLSNPITSQTRHRVAILVDGDNFPQGTIAEIEKTATRWGEVAIRRVYGDMAQHRDWAQQTDYAATHSATSAGRNRADMLLVVAAMDIAHRGLATAFLIVSDDRDFDPLVSHMREQGYRVERIGKPKTVSQEASRAGSKPGQMTDPDAMLRRVRAIIKGAGQAGFPLQSLGAALHQQGIKISDSSAKNWRAWLTSHPSDFVCDPRGPEARVRVRS